MDTSKIQKNKKKYIVELIIHQEAEYIPHSVDRAQNTLTVSSSESLITLALFNGISTFVGYSMRKPSLLVQTSNKRHSKFR